MTAAKRKARNVLIVAAAIVAIAAFLPWASFLGYSKSGISGDGILTLICAIAGGLLLWRDKLGWVGQIVLAAAVVLLGLYDLNQAGNLAAIGLYLTFLAGIAWIVGAAMLRAAGRSAPQADPSDGPAPAASTAQAEVTVASSGPMPTGEA